MVVQKELNMRTVETLIREAIDKAGGPAALARELGVHRSEITEYEKGRRKIGAACIAQMGSYAGIEPEELRRLTLEAVINSARPAWQERMRNALFTLLAVGVTLSAATTNDAKAQTGARGPVDTIYIVAHWMLRRLRKGAGQIGKPSKGLPPLTPGLRPRLRGAPLTQYA